VDAGENVGKVHVEEKEKAHGIVRQQEFPP